ncbi:hypothetical protein OS493_025823 [Desmophyllum pertusum]|uniref:Transketolase N-terminal domain-containing protein n=1 Tax=Desmophyllum pertusum TaxID=174260 RepID=A0A9W9ZA43_9CNID|nr:hypothetical protein OS493_025823 [Desmophyllum pertusum]
MNCVFPRWNTIVIDGHDVEAVCRAFHEAKTSEDRPTAILAKTYKGKGVPGVEDELNFHGKALGDKGKAAVELMKNSISGTLNGLGPQPVIDDAPAVDLTVKLSEPPNYKMGDKVNSYKVKGATSRMAQSVLIFSILNHPCSCLVYLSKLLF